MAQKGVSNVLVWHEGARIWRRGITSSDGSVIRMGSEEHDTRQTLRVLLPVDSGAGALLLAAAAHGDIAIVATLIGAQVSISYSDERANTPLHMAATNGHADVVTLLLKSSRDVMAPNMDGHTAWDFALRGSSGKVRRVFHPSSVDLDAECGPTPSAAMSNRLRQRDHARDLLKAAIVGNEVAIKDIHRTTTEQGTPICRQARAERATLHAAAWAAAAQLHGTVP